MHLLRDYIYDVVFVPASRPTAMAIEFIALVAMISQCTSRTFCMHAAGRIVLHSNRTCWCERKIESPYREFPSSACMMDEQRLMEKCTPAVQPARACFGLQGRRIQQSALARAAGEDSDKRSFLQRTTGPTVDPGLARRCACSSPRHACDLCRLR
jgi:hypothetical protein